MSAKRFAVSVAAGDHASQHYPFVTTNGGGLEWNVVVLDGLTIDLKVFARLHVQGSHANSKTLLLQEMKNTRGFHGSFEPMTDDRLLDPSGDPESRAKVAEIIFDINNTFSWFTGKAVEIVAVDTPPPGPPPAKVPALPPMEPHSPAPHNDSAQTDTSATCMNLPELLAPEATSKTTLMVLCECLATQLDTWLSNKHADAPHVLEIEWFMELHKRVMELRDFSQCKVEEERQAFEAKMAAAIASKAEEARLAKEAQESAKKAERERQAQEVAEAKASAVQKAEEERLARKATEDALKVEEQRQIQEAEEAAAANRAEEEHLARAAEIALVAAEEAENECLSTEVMNVSDEAEIEHRGQQFVEPVVAASEFSEEEHVARETAHATQNLEDVHPAHGAGEVELAVARKAEEECLVQESVMASPLEEDERHVQEILEGGTAVVEGAREEHLTSETVETIQNAQIEIQTHGFVEKDPLVKEDVEIEEEHPTQETPNGVAVAPIAESDSTAEEIVDAVLKTDEHVEENSTPATTQRSEEDEKHQIQDAVVPEEFPEAAPKAEEECQEQEVLEGVAIATERAEGGNLDTETTEELQNAEVVEGQLVQDTGIDLS